MKKTRALALVVAVAGGLTALGALASPASATDHAKLPACHACTTVVKTDASGILTTSNGEAVTETNRPSSAIVHTGNGVEVTLPDDQAKAGYTVALDEPVLLSAVARLRYLTWQLNPSSVALPSLNLTLDFNGADAGGFTTLVYEPYVDGRTIELNHWQTWDALRGGDAKWWSTRPLLLLPDGGTRGTAWAWNDILAKYPNAVMKAYGLNFGKGSPGAHARWQALTVGTIDWCTATVWPSTSPSPSPSITPTSPSVPPTTTPPTTPPTTPTTVPPTEEPTSAPSSTPGPGGQGIGQGPGSLALTGAHTPFLLQPLALGGMGAVLLASGLLLFAAFRRNRSV
jgi:hypothetical protein